MIRRLNPRNSMNRTRRTAFTLVELLVVIGIIALLISILLPSLNRARWAAASVANLSNLRQLGVGVEFYRNDHAGFFPSHSSDKALTVNSTPPKPRTRWADYVYPYLQGTDVYRSPLLNDKAQQTAMKPFAHTVSLVGGSLDYSKTIYYGGYGYNFQYLGNARVKPGNLGPFHAGSGSVRASSQTVMLADTKGSRDGDASFDYDEATYVVDPPLQSLDYGSLGSRASSADPTQAGNYGYTGGDGAAAVVVEDQRATPDARNNGDQVAVVFVDGHGRFLRPAQLDDSDGDDLPDNGLWNGFGDPSKR